MPTVAGGWLGEYHFDNGFQEPCGFEATFSSVGPDGTFRGTILDDGPLGEAVLHHARQVGESILFTKVYRLKHQDILPVRYEGRFFNDGRLLRGTWAIYGGRGNLHTMHTGWWEVRRSWEALTPSG